MVRCRETQTYDTQTTLGVVQLICWPQWEQNLAPGRLPWPQEGHLLGSAAEGAPGSGARGVVREYQNPMPALMILKIQSIAEAFS